jgi:NAD(P)-dependent dehydrogenase (short-subunit alcohol dehydrogenase family)
MPTRPPPLRGQVVLITGAGSGMGAAAAGELRRRGALPVLVDCDTENVQAVARSLGTDVLANGQRPRARAGDTVCLSAPGLAPSGQTVVKEAA